MISMMRYLSGEKAVEKAVGIPQAKVRVGGETRGVETARSKSAMSVIVPNIL